MASVSKRRWTHNGQEREAWVVRYSDNSGRRRIKTFERKKDADAYRTTLEVELGRGEHVADRASLTLSRVLDLWLEHCEARVKIRDRIRPRAVRQFRSWTENHIRPEIGHLRVNAITARDVQAYLYRLATDKERPRTHATLLRVYSGLRLALKYAFKAGFVGRNVLADAEIQIPGRPNKRREVPSKEQMAKYLAASFENNAPGGVAAWLPIVLHLAVFTGMRQGEIRALRWANVDFDKRVIRVREGADNFCRIDDPKTEAGNRDIPIPSHLVTLLKAWKLRSRPNALDLVVTTSRGRMLLPANVISSWARLSVRVEKGKGQTKRVKPQFVFHSIRHFAASVFIEAGLSPKRVQYLMGHASIQMTYDTYGHLFDDDGAAAAAIEKVSAILVAR